MLKDFKDFISQRNVLDMAVGVVMGSAVTNIVNALVDAIIMPIINAVLGNASIDEFAISIGPTQIKLGVLVQAIIDFLIIALILFLIVRAVNKIIPKKEEAKEPTSKACPYCKTEIDIEASRCPNCTSELEVSQT